ncbi:MULTISPECIES: DUF4064 domain-containing protein [Bacillaceae]|uniref:DUF4064 domain-containing protein n=1 Tax=Bacillaceae TaxID=186817 RepID=UPI002A16936F|nr:DUF4064 domain-containing protein [Cytobacillus sp. IB215316]MDX8359505.1 DUF4064 domain-containing protein [Cytobacillus sp. IB215316]
MKRTGEIVLSIIGAVLSGFLAIIGGAFTYLMTNEAFLQELEAQFATDPQLATFNIADLMEIIGNTGWIVVAAGMIGLVLSIIAAFCLKGNNKPKLAGTLLIIAALLVALMTVLFAWPIALLFLIAGIMSLVRKPKQNIYD